MLDIQRILYPTDFSETARQALPWAASLADHHGAGLHVLHALSLHAADPASLEGAFPIPESVFDDWTRRAEEALEETAETSRERGLTVRQEIRRSIAPSSAILDYADEEGIDLVVMGTHGRRGLRHLALGSVVEEVLRFAPVPVLAVRKREELESQADLPLPELDRILVPVDFSEHADLALETGVELARDYGIALDVLYVVEQITYPDFYYPAAPSRERMAREVSEKAGERLERRVGEYEKAGEMTVDFDVQVGRPEDRICTRAEEEGADLIVMGSHGRTGLSRVLLGSVTEGVIRRAPCPVLVVKLREEEE